MRPSRNLSCISTLFFVTLAIAPSPALAQPGWNYHPRITGISVGESQLVLPPVPQSPVNVINAYEGLGNLADEHSTVIPPGTLPGHPFDYLFFVPTTTSLNQTTSGLVVLSGGFGPDWNGQWTLSYAPDYDQSPLTAPDGNTNGQIFISPFQRNLCPGNSPQDTTFDLNYANGGSVIIDPTRSPSSRLLMIYEGTTVCINQDGGSTQNGVDNFYATLGVATSLNYGKIWPSYRATSFALPLPGQSTTVGPQAPGSGAFGSLVCMGNDCNTTPPSTFGRYPVISAPYSIQDLVVPGSNDGIPDTIGNQGPSAFVDDVHPGSRLYVYTLQNYGCPATLYQCGTTAPNDKGVLTVSRALLNGNKVLQFENWYSSSFSVGSIGGGQSAIFPEVQMATPAQYAACEDARQLQGMGSINYFPLTRQYILIFSCRSPTDPANPGVQPPNTGGQYHQDGVAWFFSTLDASQYDLSRQDQWTTPVEISGSWQWLGSNGSTTRNPYCIYDGWYATFMSLYQRPSWLSPLGFAFSMDGCTDAGAGRSRYYRSRVFLISVAP